MPLLSPIPGTIAFGEKSSTPSTPPAGYALIYLKTDNVLYILDSNGVETPIGSASFISSLVGDVSASGPGVSTATVNSVGGKTASEIAQSVSDTQAATDANTPSTIVKRDSSGNFSAGLINSVSIQAHASRHLPSGADALTTSAPTTDLSATTTNTTGSANSFARGDHTHAIDTGAASTQTPDQSNATGSASTLARSDHIHNIPTAIAVDIATTNSQGSASSFSRADHTHKGVRSLKANTDSQRFGDLSLVNGVGTTVTDDGSGNFTIEVVGGASEFSVSYPGSGLSVNYTSGKVIFNGVQTFIPAGSVAVPASTTNGYVYVDIDGTVKSASSLPSNTIPLSVFNSSLSLVTFLEDARVFLAQSLVWGLTADVQALSATSATAGGSSNKYARADHIHAIPSSAPSTQTPDQSNATGSSTDFARADHIHDIPTATAVGLSATTTNTQGSASSFARSDHTHAIATGTVSTQTPDQANSTGTSANLARADHQHNIPTAAPLADLTAITTNAQGSAASFSRSDHSHAIDTGVVSTQTPDQANAAGSSANLARADHIHDIPTSAPITTLSPATTNTLGSAASFARGDHTHAIATSLVGDITTILPNDVASAGIVNKYARGDHKHAIATATPSTITPDQTNTEGSSSSFARADHIHNIPSGTPVQIGTSNFAGAATSFALSDHVHAHGNQTGTTLHALATGSLHGFMSSTDKTKLDASTASNTPSTLVFRDSSGNFSAGTITANLTGTATNATLAVNFSGSLSGDVTGTQSATVVSFVGTSSAANVHSAELAANAATSTNTVSTIVKRDASGNFSAGTITANLTGNASGSAATFTGSLSGDVTGTQSATVIAVGAVTDAKASLAGKPSVAVVATTNQTLSGTPTIDGQATVSGNLILLTAQTTGSENGPWVVAAGAWSRPTWYPNSGTTQAFQFITILVRLGTTYGGSVWKQTVAAPITIDTTATTWVVIPTSGNYKSTYTIGPASGTSPVNLAFANAVTAILAWNPTSPHTLTLPPTQGAAGTFPSNDGAGNLTWTNPIVNIDGGAASSNYTPAQLINGGTA